MERQAAVSVAIVEDHQLLGQLVAFELERRSVDVQLLVLDETVADRVVLIAPALVLLDIELGLQVSSLEICSRLVSEGIGVVIFTGINDAVELGRFLEAGALGVISKTEDLETLAEQLLSAMNGEAISPSVGNREAMAQALQSHRAARDEALEPFERLSESEAEVLVLMCDGRSAVEIAELRFVSITTVRAQVRAILSKLGVHSQLGAVTLASRVGWPSVDYDVDGRDAGENEAGHATQ